MNDLIVQLRSIPELPLPGGGNTAVRHQALVEIARKNLSLARLAEAHFDALSILAEAGRTPVLGALYGVWASEIPGHAITLKDNKLFGQKRFCTGAGMLDRALVTTTDPEHRLIDVDLRAGRQSLDVSTTEWTTPAFSDTSTATVTFAGTSFAEDEIVGAPRWYLDRPGFWAGGIAPGACWAGGALGLIDWAVKQKRDDPHTLAHLGALHAAAWNLESIVLQAGSELDAHPKDANANMCLALAVRHLVEQSCTEVLTRIGRAYGPYPLALNAEISRRYSELQLYIRQCHAERDLEALGRLVHSRKQVSV